MKLSPNFYLDEFTVSETAARMRIDNTPSPQIVSNLHRLALILEDVRSALGNRVMTITSGYRCPPLNSAIGGSPKSDHMLGMAADFRIHSFGTPYEICNAILAAQIPFKQLIHEYGRWVHLAIPPLGVAPVMDARTICDSVTGYQPGIHPCGV